jgi:LPS-assembly lipoprotein
MQNKILVLSAVLALTACGFEPMYGNVRFNEPTPQEAAIEAQLENIAIGNIPNREGQILRNALIDRFYRNGRPQNPSYTVDVAKVHETTTDLDITKESDATRAQLRLDATVTLRDNQGNTVLTRDLTSIGSYNILTSEFATRVSEDNMRENALNDLARQIELQVVLFLKGTQN